MRHSQTTWVSFLTDVPSEVVVSRCRSEDSQAWLQRSDGDGGMPPAEVCPTFNYQKHVTYAQTQKSWLDHAFH